MNRANAFQGQEMADKTYKEADVIDKTRLVAKI